MREADLERAEIVLITEAYAAKVTRVIRAPRAKVFIVKEQGEDSVALLKAAALARWGAKINEVARDEGK